LGSRPFLENLFIALNNRRTMPRPTTSMKNTEKTVVMVFAEASSPKASDID